MKKFILGIIVGVIIVLGALLLLRQSEGETASYQQTNNALNKIRQQQNYQNNSQKKLQEAVLNFSKAKENKDILKSLDEILKYRPQDPNLYALKAQILQKQGNFPVAIEAINKAISLDPQNPNYYQIRAEIEFNNGEFNNAVQDFTIAAQLSGKADNYYNRAIANLNLGNYKMANNDFKKAQELYKKEGNSNASKQARNISQMLTESMPKQEVQNEGATTPKTNKSTAKTQSNSSIDKKTMNQISQSLKRFSENEALNDVKKYLPKTEDVQHILGDLKTQMSTIENPIPQQEKAIPSLEDMINQPNIQAPKMKQKDLLKGTPLQSILKSQKMLVNKDFEGAKAELDSAINNFPDNDSLYYHRAQVNYQNGDYKSAFADLNKAINLNHNNYQAILSRGDLFNSLGQNEQAKKDYLNAANVAEQMGNTRAAEEAQTRYQLLEGKDITARANQRFVEASNAYHNGDYGKAVNLFNQIYEENPDGANAFNLGLAYMGQGDIKKANEMFLLAAEQKPQDFNTQLAVAQSAVNIDDFDVAKKHLDKAMEINDTDPNIWTLAAQIDSHNGDYAATTNDLKKALNGFQQKLDETKNGDERRRIENQIEEIKSFLEKLAEAGF